jgi:hypothetical protein
MGARSAVRTTSEVADRDGSDPQDNKNQLSKDIGPCSDEGKREKGKRRMLISLVEP